MHNSVHYAISFDYCTAHPQRENLLGLFKIETVVTHCTQQCESHLAVFLKAFFFFHLADKAVF